MGRSLRVLVAWGAGWTIYLVAMLLWSYDGVLSLVLQPVVAGVVAAGAVGLAGVVGLVLRVRPIGRAWHGHPGRAIGLIVAALAMLGLGSAVGLTGEYVAPETGREFTALHPAAALLGYLAIIFALLHWPSRRPAGKGPARDELP